MSAAPCNRCGRANLPSAVDCSAVAPAHVDPENGNPCREWLLMYTPEDQAANLEALLAEIESWP